MSGVSDVRRDHPRLRSYVSVMEVVLLIWLLVLSIQDWLRLRVSNRVLVAATLTTGTVAYVSREPFHPIIAALAVAVMMVAGFPMGDVKVMALVALFLGWTAVAI